MESNDKKVTGSNDQINADQNTKSASVADQILLKALQDFIVPLIRVVDKKRKDDLSQIPLGPEAGNLVTALREFISNIVRGSQSRAPNTVKVSLIEDKNEVGADLHEDEDNDGGSDEDNDLSSASDPPSEPEDSNSMTDSVPEGNDIVDKPLPTFHEKLLSALRKHVFNTMPIRLLSFDSNGSSLQISLLERGGVSARLESALRANIHKPDHVPISGYVGGSLETDEEAIERLISRYARYAILSHAWLQTAPGEVTYSDWNTALFDMKGPGYQKLVNFCKIAWKNHGLAFGWMDTVCINKESSAELDESIRSMYNWYHRASVCIIYLSGATDISNMHMDRWFTRGWTLQELLAPTIIKFYNSNWRKIVGDSDNDKTHAEITQQIESITTITESELRNIYYSPISRRMELAANREVTREEDMAYSLMGIFDISISTAYGEGASRAFSRLLQTILNLYAGNVMDIFNWAGELPESSLSQERSSLLPPSPQYYLCRSSNKNLLLGRTQPIEPLTPTHLGLRITVILMPAISISSTSIQGNAIGDFHATVNISPLGLHDDIPTSYYILDSRINGRDGHKEGNDWHQYTFAVFNFDGNETDICIPKTCIAFGLECEEPVGKVTALGYRYPIETSEPIVFDLKQSDTLERNDSNEDTASNVGGDDDEDDDYSIIDWEKGTYYRLKKQELAEHSMQLVSLYL